MLVLHSNIWLHTQIYANSLLMALFYFVTNSLTKRPIMLFQKGLEVPMEHEYLCLIYYKCVSWMSFERALFNRASDTALCVCTMLIIMSEKSPDSRQ